jgi:hypothetical protein
MTAADAEEGGLPSVGCKMMLSQPALPLKCLAAFLATISSSGYIWPTVFWVGPLEEVGREWASAAAVSSIHSSVSELFYLLKWTPSSSRSNFMKIWQKNGWGRVDMECVRIREFGIIINLVNKVNGGRRGNESTHGGLIHWTSI